MWGSDPRAARRPRILSSSPRRGNGAGAPRASPALGGPLRSGRLLGRREGLLLHLRPCARELAAEIDWLGPAIAGDDVRVPALQGLNVMTGPRGEVVQVHSVAADRVGRVALGEVERGVLGD